MRRHVINPICGYQRKQFSMYYLPTKSHCHSFNGLEVLKGVGGGGGCGGIRSLRFRNEKKPRLNRIKERKDKKKREKKHSAELVVRLYLLA